jgi:hypothetical protein
MKKQDFIRIFLKEGKERKEGTRPKHYAATSKFPNEQQAG